MAPRLDLQVEGIILRVVAVRQLLDRLDAMEGSPEQRPGYLDPKVADAYMEEMWGVDGARAYERVLAETGDTKLAWAAAKAAQKEAT